MSDVDVTVVIPVRNRRAALHVAIRSVLAQTVRPREIIVIDDASTDGTADAAREMPVRVLEQTSALGSGIARNRGIAEARTEYVAFLDSDDEWFEGHLESTTANLSKHVFVTAPMIDSFNRVRGNADRASRIVTPDSLFFPENIVCTSTVVARRDALDSVGGFDDLPRAQDLDLWVRLLDRGSALALGEPTARYAIDQPYQEPGLRSRSRTGAQVVQSRYADEPWMTRRLVNQIRTQHTWDDLRHAQHHRDARSAVRSIAALARHRSTPGALLQLLQHRRLARRRSATMGAL